MAKVYLNLDVREIWNEEFIKSIVGYYTIKIPLKCPTTCIVTQDYEVIRRVKEVLYKDIEQIKISKEEVEVFCYKGEGDFVETLEDLYHLKNEVEDRVKSAMNEVDIYDYALVVNVDTLY